MGGRGGGDGYQQDGSAPIRYARVLHISIGNIGKQGRSKTGKFLGRMHAVFCTDPPALRLCMMDIVSEVFLKNLWVGRGGDRAHHNR